MKNITVTNQFATIYSGLQLLTSESLILMAQYTNNYITFNNQGDRHE